MSTWTKGPVLTKEEAIERIEGVLKSVGITLELFAASGACDCTTFMAAEFPDGAKFEGYDVNLYVRCDGLSHQRG